MAQISKKYLDRKTQERIFATFSEFFYNHISKDRSGVLLSQFLTPTEKIYFTKRFMIAYFLIKEVDYRTICDVLKVSLSTIGRVAQRLEFEKAGLKQELTKFFAKKERIAKTEDPFGLLDALFIAPGKWHKETQSRQHRQEHKS